METEDDSDVPETGAIFTFGKSKFGENASNKFWIRNDEVVQVSCGDEHTALLAASGRVFTFGANGWGQLGLGHTKTVKKPMRIKALRDEKVTHVSCGRGHTIFATASGCLYACGANGEGQLGLDESEAAISSPRRLHSMPTCNVKMLSCGADHSALLTEGGELFVWGGGSEGQLGLADQSQANTPTLLPADSRISYVSCGYYHTAYVTEGGQLYTFGETEGGKLGHARSPCASPQPVTAGDGAPYVAVACGGTHTAAVTENGTVYTFGDGGTGQLGHGTTVLTAEIPLAIAWPRMVKVKSVSCGENHTAIVTDDAQMYTFGDGRHGKLALGEESFSNQFQPSAVERFVNFTIDQVSCGGCHTLVIGRLRYDSPDSDPSVNRLVSPNTSLSETYDLSASISARNRRREKIMDPHHLLNRTLPALNINSVSAGHLSALNLTVPSFHPRKSHPAKRDPVLPVKKERNLASFNKDMNMTNAEETVTVHNERETAGRPLPKPRKLPMNTHRPAAVSRGEESEEESIDEQSADDSQENTDVTKQHQNSETKKQKCVHKKDTKEKSDDSNEEIKKDKKSVPAKKKRRSTGIFQKRRIPESSSESEAERSDESDVESDERRAGSGSDDPRGRKARRDGEDEHQNSKVRRKHGKNGDKGAKSNSESKTDNDAGGIEGSGDESGGEKDGSGEEKEEGGKNRQTSKKKSKKNDKKEESNESEAHSEEETEEKLKDLSNGGSEKEKDNKDKQDSDDKEDETHDEKKKSRTCCLL